jgi:hypothetical protein
VLKDKVVFGQCTPPSGTAMMRAAAVALPVRQRAFSHQAEACHAPAWPTKTRPPFRPDKPATCMRIALQFANLSRHTGKVSTTPARIISSNHIKYVSLLNVFMIYLCITPAPDRTF